MRLARSAHYGLSADQPVEGGDESSAPLTHAEAQGDGARSVGRLVAKMDLRFLHRHMDRTERFIFDARYFGDVDDVTLYTEPGYNLVKRCDLCRVRISNI